MTVVVPVVQVQGAECVQMALVSDGGLLMERVSLRTNNDQQGVGRGRTYQRHHSKRQPCTVSPPLG
jgi:hypothetical protein